MLEYDYGKLESISKRLPMTIKPTYIHLLNAIMLALLWCSFSLSATPKADFRVELSQTELEADLVSHVIVQMSLKPEPVQHFVDRPRINLALVFDRSISMEGKKIHKAKLTAIKAIESLGSGDVFSLTVYGTTADVVIPATPVTDRESLIKQIRRIQPQGNTALFAGISVGAAEIRKNLTENSVNRIIVLSDGFANIGPESAEELGRLGRALIKEGISVSTFGIGLDYNESLMTRLALNSDGNSYFVEDSENLASIFAYELGNVMKVAAARIRLDLKCLNGARPIRVIGRNGLISGNNAVVTLNQAYAGHEKYVLVSVEVPPGKADTNRSLIVATCSYTDLSNGEKIQQMVAGDVRFVPTQQEAIASANQQLLTQYATQEYYNVANVGLESAEAGQLDEALEVLSYNAITIRQKGDSYQNRALTVNADRLDRLADELRKKGRVSETMSKAYRSNFVKAVQNMRPTQQEISVPVEPDLPVDGDVSSVSSTAQTVTTGGPSDEMSPTKPDLSRDDPGEQLH